MNRGQPRAMKKSIQRSRTSEVTPGTRLYQRRLACYSDIIKLGSSMTHAYLLLPNQCFYHRCRMRLRKPDMWASSGSHITPTPIVFSICTDSREISIGRESLAWPCVYIHHLLLPSFYCLFSCFMGRSVYRIRRAQASEGVHTLRQLPAPASPRLAQADAHVYWSESRPPCPRRLV